MTRLTVTVITLLALIAMLGVAMVVMVAVALHKQTDHTESTTATEEKLANILRTVEKANAIQNASPSTYASILKKISRGIEGLESETRNVQNALLSAILGSSESSSPVCGSANAASEVVTIDYLIVGGGQGGISTLDDLSYGVSQALPPGQTSILLLESTARLGGNILAADLGNGRQADMGAQRVNLMTFPISRALAHELNHTMYASPFRNAVNMRGIRKLCGVPQTLAAASGESPLSDDFVYMFGDFCNADPAYTQGAYKTLEGVEDPSYDMYSYIFGYTNVHPFTGKKCTPNRCPRDVCAQYPDISSFIAGIFGTDERAKFFEDDNVGFYGDYAAGFSPCSYFYGYMIREWDTATHNLYPKTSMWDLFIRRRIERALSRVIPNRLQVSTQVNEGAVCVQSVTGQAHKYEVLTSKNRLIKVNQFLFLNLPAYYLQQTDKIGGNLIERLRTTPEAKFPRAQSVASVVFAYPPGKEAWFWSFFDMATGNYSFRQYGNAGCLPRAEFIDTPYHRCANFFRPVYSDWQCKRTFEDLIAKATATGTWKDVEAFVLDGLRRAFPDHATRITAPTKIFGNVFPSGWYFGGPLTSTLSGASAVGQVSAWAAKPDGQNNVCLIAESYELDYGGWSEAAFRSSKRCLSRLGLPALQALFTSRTSVFQSDCNTDDYCCGYGSNCAHIFPERGEQPFLGNEKWYPFGPYRTSNGKPYDYCANI